MDKITDQEEVRENLNHYNVNELKEECIRFDISLNSFKNYNKDTLIDLLVNAYYNTLI